MGAGNPPLKWSCIAPRRLEAASKFATYKISGAPQFGRVRRWWLDFRRAPDWFERPRSYATQREARAAAEIIDVGLASQKAPAAG